MAHEDALERRRFVDGGEAEVAGQAQWRYVVREQAVDAVGDHAHAEHVEAPLAGVCREAVYGARVEAEARRLAQHVRQHADIAQAQIKALAGDGDVTMDDLRVLALKRALVEGRPFLPGT